MSESTPFLQEDEYQRGLGLTRITHEHGSTINGNGNLLNCGSSNPSEHSDSSPDDNYIESGRNRNYRGYDSKNSPINNNNSYGNYQSSEPETGTGSSEECGPGPGPENGYSISGYVEGDHENQMYSSDGPRSPPPAVLDPYSDNDSYSKKTGAKIKSSVKNEPAARESAAESNALYGSSKTNSRNRTTAEDRKTRSTDNSEYLRKYGKAGSENVKWIQI